MCVKFLLMDTCCFIYAINKNNNSFDYDKIKDYALKNNIKIVVSAFTFYELIKGLNRYLKFYKINN